MCKQTHGRHVININITHMYEKRITDKVVNIKHIFPGVKKSVSTQ